MTAQEDPRSEIILQMLMQLAAGDLELHATHSGSGDELDAIIESINMLAEELRASFFLPWNRPKNGCSAPTGSASSGSSAVV